jgi:hypothetical protein
LRRALALPSCFIIIAILSRIYCLGYSDLLDGWRYFPKLPYQKIKKKVLHQILSLLLTDYKRGSAAGAALVQAAYISGIELTAPLIINGDIIGISLLTALIRTSLCV